MIVRIFSLRINLYTEGLVRTFKSIPEAARELGFIEAAVKKAKYSNGNRTGEYQLKWLEPKPEKPAFNR